GISFIEIPRSYLIHNPSIALNNLYHLCAYILLHIVWHGNPIVAFLIHDYRCIHCLEQAFLVNPSQNKAGLIQSFWTLGASPDAYRWERMPYRGKATALLWQCSRIGHN